MEPREPLPSPPNMWGSGRPSIPPRLAQGVPRKPRHDWALRSCRNLCRDAKQLIQTHHMKHRLFLEVGKILKHPCVVSLVKPLLPWGGSWWKITMEPPSGDGPENMSSQTHVYKYIHTYLHTLHDMTWHGMTWHTHTHTPTPARTQSHTHTHTHAHTHTHMHIYIYIYIYI